MKKTLKVCAVYIGLVIGAGFASGREILEYFNFRSNTNIGGILLSSFLFMFIAYIILSKSSESDITDFDGYIDSVAGRTAPFVKSFMLIYMFCGLFVMFSGSGAILDSVSQYSEFLGAVIMAVICFVVLSFDLHGIIALNLILVPIMICGIVFVSVCSAIFSDIPAFSPDPIDHGTVLLSAVCYSVYNTVTSGGVLIPLAKNMTLKNIRFSAVCGGFVIGLLIMLVWTVQSINFDIIYQSELPMLTVAALCGKLCKRVYTAVLFMAICTTAVSYGFGLMSHFSSKIKTPAQRTLFAGVLCLTALPFSLYGFSNLVSQLYSFFGYIGMIWIIMVIVDRYR